MELTAFQRKTLEGWRRMKPHGLTWAMGLGRLARSWIVLLALVAAVYAVALAGGPALWPVVACFVAGAMLRDLGYIRSARKIWPISLAVIDWTKVDELLQQRTDV
jgi:hypothetical protein